MHYPTFTEISKAHTCIKLLKVLFANELHALHAVVLVCVFPCHCFEILFEHPSGDSLSSEMRLHNNGVYAECFSHWVMILHGFLGEPGLVGEGGANESEQVFVFV